jgi:hypothetical protein
MARPLGPESAIRPEKQVPRGAPEQIGDPPLRKVMRAIVGQVAALTEAAQVAQAVVARIVIQVRGGQHDARRPHHRHLFEVGPAGGPAAPISPRVLRRIVPSPVRQAAHGSTMRPAATLAYAVGALEADAPTELARQCAG